MSSSSVEISTTASHDQHHTSADGVDASGDGGREIIPPPPIKYTLKQAFYKAYNSTPPQNENDMLLTKIPLEDKGKLIDYYEFANNPSPYVDKYYIQYHAFELVVFKRHAAETWDAIVKFFKNTQTLSKRYSKNLSYMLQKQRHCANSYSTVILLIIAYPRHRQKQREVSEQFIIDSGLKSHFSTWGISACKSYTYLSPEEYIKLLNTHAEGCFVSHVYPRFRASTDEWDSRMIRRRQEEDDAFRAFTKDWEVRLKRQEEHDDGDNDECDSSSSCTSDDDDCCDGRRDTAGDDPSTASSSSDGSSCDSDDDDDDTATAAPTPPGTVTNSDEEDGQDPDALPPAVVVDGGMGTTTRRFFSPPHPSLGVASSASCATRRCNSAKLSSPGGLKDGDAATAKMKKKHVTFCEKSPSKMMLDRFYRATGFMSHANCGLHRLTVVAKDIHKHTNTLIFHKRSFDRRYEKDVVRSKDYLLPHHHSGGSGGAPRQTKNNNNNNNRKRKLIAIAATTTPAIQQQHLKKKKKT